MGSRGSKDSKGIEYRLRLNRDAHTSEKCVAKVAKAAKEANIDSGQTDTHTQVKNG